ncbi:Casein kinase II subunit beta-3 [Coccomyxa viridis]|uniref:Casein kinase II subunit beta n=1 Tax=Coccomyxa viridis TaxID=1274662 RepID=A0AAV1HXW8_9CHLO|nr:Casein kinase II subunit beta-3 [Coccomyxa viridis]
MSNQAYQEELVSETDSSSSDEATGSEDEVAAWIGWFCSLKGNEFFCEVDEEFIQDDFNLSGLSSQVSYYDYALDLILDADSPSTEILTDEQHELVESAAETLYGLIHVRYILTSRGMNAMYEKYKACEFGRCPRVLCNGQPCLPVGTCDVPRQSTVKIFCPKCQDIYYPRSKYQGNVDGAFFGTTFPHLLLMTYPSIRPQRPPEQYAPRVFGFKLHSSALACAEGQSSGAHTNSVGGAAASNRNCTQRDQHMQQARKREDESGPSQTKSNQRRHT